MLLKKLKPPYLAILERRNVEYPAFIGCLIDEIEELEYVSDMKWETFSDLKTVLGNVDTPFDYFNVEKPLRHQ